MIPLPRRSPLFPDPPLFRSDLGVASPVVKSGYSLSYAGLGTAVNTQTCVTATTTASPSYFAAGAPVAPGTTGTRYFRTSGVQTDLQGTRLHSTHRPISGAVP